MAKVVIGAEIKVDGLDAAGQSVGSFKAQLREAQADLVSMADKFGLASSQAQNAAKKVAGLKDSIGDAKALAETFNPDKKFVALGGALQGVTAGFSAYSGLMGVLGVQSKETEKLLLKVQSAMALQQGISGIKGAMDSFGLLGKSALAALKSIRTGIAATGIGVLLIALGAIVAYWDDIKEFVSGVSSEQKRLNKLTEDNLKAQQKKLDTIGDQDNILKLQGKSERDILKLKIKQTDEVIKATEQSILQAQITKTAQVAAAKKNHDILAGILKFSTAGIQVIIEGIDYVYEKLTGKKLIDFNVADYAASFLFDPKEIETEADKVIEEQKKALGKLKNDRAGYELSVNAIDKSASDKRQAASDAAAKKKEEAAKKAEEVRLQQAKNSDALIEESRLLAVKDTFTKSQLELEDKHQKEIDAQIDFLNKKEINATEYEKRKLLIDDKYKILQAGLLTEKEAKDKETTKATREKELTDLKAHNDAKLAEVLRVNAASGEDSPEAAMLKIQNIAAAKIEAENAAYEIEKEQKAGQLGELALLQENHKNKLISIDQEKTNATKAIAEAELAHKKSIQQSQLDLVSSGIALLKDIAGKNKGLQKAAIIAENALGIAKIIINTNAANAATILKYALIPGGKLKAASEIIRNKIGAGIGIVSSIAATAKALSAVGGGGAASGGGNALSGGAGGGSSEPVTAPLAPQAQVTNLSQASINAVGNAANRAYVLETDVSNNQERIRRLNRASRIN